MTTQPPPYDEFRLTDEYEYLIAPSKLLIAHYDVSLSVGVHLGSLEAATAAGNRLLTLLVRLICGFDR